VQFVEEDDEPKEDGGKGKKKGGKGKSGKGKGKEDGEEGEGIGTGTGEMTVLDEIWPKKEALGLTKWCVRLAPCRI